MKLTLLVDNTVLDSQSLLAEFGFSCYIETGGKYILFDVGYSNILIHNADKLRINLSTLDFIALSHGHLDHTWGMMNLTHLLDNSESETKITRKIPLIGCSSLLDKKYDTDGSEIGINYAIPKNFNLRLTNKPQWLTERLVFLGKIRREFDFEKTKPLGKILGNGESQDDFLFDDSALAYKSSDGLVIITGCSHSGICNIVEHAKEVCNENRVVDIIGGLHLLNADPGRLKQTSKYFKELNLSNLHVCHCTDTTAKIALSRTSPIADTGVGLTLTFD